MMVDKKDFYHGAVFAQLIESEGRACIEATGNGYLVDDRAFLYIKYSTKNRSPWGFVLSEEELSILSNHSEHHPSHLALVCGGDGICCFGFDALLQICGRQGGWISVSRPRTRMYSIAGPLAEYSRKIPRRIHLFSSEIELNATR
jgi:hypothetical protein